MQPHQPLLDQVCRLVEEQQLRDPAQTMFVLLGCVCLEAAAVVLVVAVEVVVMAVVVGMGLISLLQPSEPTWPQTLRP